MKTQFAKNPKTVTPTLNQIVERSVNRHKFLDKHPAQMFHAFKAAIKK